MSTIRQLGVTEQDIEMTTKFLNLYECLKPKKT